MKIYLAGPMRGIPEFNFPAFDVAREALRAEGHEVFCPAENDRSKTRAGHPMESDPTGDEANASRTIRECMLDDTAYICQRAEAIALLPGWEFSKGANAELALADALGLKKIILGGKPPLRNVVLDAGHATKIADTCEEVRRELVNARAKYGRFRGAHEGWGVLREEYLELELAIISNDPKAIRKEAIQVAAMAASMVTDLY